ncbi:MAG: hypothetical protein HYV96_01910 [Opitutae bacterium]|nr:hypothetical protein [Opitutae bacterium]
MKATLLPLRGLVAAATLIAGVVTAAASSQAAAPDAKGMKIADLQLQINVPPTWRPFLDDDIAESLAGILTDTFKRRGYTGIVDYIEEGRRAPNPDLPLLTLNLIQWRIDRIGNAECTLNAELAVPGNAKRELGIVTQTRLTWIQERGRYGFRRFEIADALEDAATEAMRELFKRVADTGLLRGFPAPKAKK